MSPSVAAGSPQQRALIPVQFDEEGGRFSSKGQLRQPWKGRPGTGCFSKKYVASNLIPKIISPHKTIVSLGHLPLLPVEQVGGQAPEGGEEQV